MVFKKKYNPNEERFIRIITHPVPEGECHFEIKSRLFSHQEIADWLNTFFEQYNEGTRKGRGIYGYLKRDE